MSNMNEDEYLHEYMGIMVVYNDHCEYRTDVLTGIDIGILEQKGFHVIGVYPTMTILGEMALVVLLEHPYKEITEGEA